MMRPFAWFLVILGVLVSLVASSNIYQNIERMKELCYKAALSGLESDNPGGCGDKRAHPLTGFLYGLPVTAFGILLLAVRPAEPKR